MYICTIIVMYICIHSHAHTLIIIIVFNEKPDKKIIEYSIHANKKIELNKFLRWVSPNYSQKLLFKSKSLKIILVVCNMTLLNERIKHLLIFLVNINLMSFSMFYVKNY